MKELEIFRTALSDASVKSKEVQFVYRCGTTSTNREYIDVLLNGTQINHINGCNPKTFSVGLAAIVEQLKDEYPTLHVIEKKREFHFYFPGFNSCCTHVVPFSLSLKDADTEVKKTGKVTESYSMVGWKKVEEVVKAHPDYELYKRRGFGFRGAQESRADIDDLKRLCDWAACVDIEVIDNEIHVNGFSYSDME